MEEENYCNRCPTGVRGLCCWYSVLLTGENGEKHQICVLPCEYLNKAGRCRIYKKRFEVKKNPKCLTVEEALKMGTLPEECLYVKNSENYQPHVPFKIKTRRKAKNGP